MDKIERLSINISSFSQPAECRLDFLRKKLANILAEFSQADIASITGYGFILEALSVAGL